jgi:hypothetical protein
MRVSLRTQGEELMGLLQQIMTQLALTGDTLTDAVDTTLQQHAADALKRIG